MMHAISFPRKMLTGNFKPETIAQRSRAFEQYLTHVFSIDPLRLSQDFHDFFCSDNQHRAYNFITTEHYREAITLLKDTFHLQQKLLGDNHQETLTTLCALVIAAEALEQDSLAIEYADFCLQCMGSEKNCYLVPLLHLSIHLCWKTGKDKKDLEEKLQKLKESGVDIDEGCKLRQLVMSSWKAKHSTSAE